MMRILPFLLVTLFYTNSLAQKNPTKKSEAIVEEGTLMYQSEMASWYGTDYFLANYKNKNNIGGYFSYVDGSCTKCVFFSREKTPSVIGTIIFDESLSLANATKSLEERDFSGIEQNLYEIRSVALSQIQTDTAFFKHYENTNPNLIPLIHNGTRKVYVLTGPTQAGVVIFGNDYLLTFDENNNLTSSKAIHTDILPIYYGVSAQAEGIEETMHTHSEETGDLITASDICTLMLYSKFAEWKKHYVVSAKYTNFWDCENSKLAVLPRKVFEKMKKKSKNKERGK